MRTWTSHALLCATVIVGHSASAEPASPKPNFIISFTNDQDPGNWKLHWNRQKLTQVYNLATGIAEKKKLTSNPALKGSDNPKDFDSHLIDDACLILRDGKYWFYDKGRQLGKSPSQPHYPGQPRSARLAAREWFDVEE